MLLCSSLFLLFIGFTSALWVNVKDCGKHLDIDFRALSGSLPPYLKYPWMVHLQHGTQNIDYCGGTIINENWIVTAANCVNKSNYENTHVAYVGLRSIKKLEARHVQKLELSKIIVHPHYKDSNNYDIALIKTKSIINILKSGGHVNAICLPNPSYRSMYSFGNATIIGWNLNEGCRKPGNQTTDELKEACVSITSPDTCMNISSFADCKITEIFVCAGAYKTNICSRNSGDPLFQKNERGVAYLVGITPTFRKQNMAAPTAYTNVAFYLNWIDKEIKLNEDGHTGIHDAL